MVSGFSLREDTFTRKTSMEYFIIKLISYYVHPLRTDNTI